ncbi:MAG: RsmE family RNA methyltransferase [Rectinemataceae bacterium]
MRRLVLPGDRSADTFWKADRDTTRYLVRVLRLGMGAEFPASDAAGNRFRCTITNADPEGAVLRMDPAGVPAGVPARVPTGVSSSRGKATDSAKGAGRAEKDDASPPVDFGIVLVQALPKGRKLDAVIRQATEAGVRQILPIVTEHCVARDPGTERADARSGRFERLVREALQQSGSDVATTVAPVVPFARLEEALDAAGYGRDRTLRLFCHEKPLAKDSLHDYLADGPKTVVVAIGPEGGFSAAECARFIEMGFRPLYFPGAVLRTETAALYAVAAIKTVFSERASWKPTT